MAKSKYKKEKEKAERIFNKQLSDREFAEALLGKIDFLLSEFETYADAYRDALGEAKLHIEDMKSLREWYGD